MPRLSAVSYARYIGRVGALAVALGVGMAVGTNGSGLAWAQTDPAGGSPKADEQSQTTPNQDTETDTPAGTVPADSDAGDSGNDGVGAEGSDAGAGIGTDSGMEVDAAGVDTSNNDAGQATDGTAGTVSDGEDSDGDDVPGFGDKDVEQDPAQNPLVSNGSQDQTAVGLNKNTRRQGTSPVVSSNDGTGVDAHRIPDADADADAGTVAMSRLKAAVPGGGGAAAVVDDDQGTRQMAAAAVVDQAQPDPVQSLLAIPGTVYEVVTSFVGALLSPFFAPGPGAPAEPPLLWALLGWVHREIQRTFFNRSPHAEVDEVTTSEDSDGVVIDVLKNDSDPDEDALTVTEATALHGSVIVKDDGTLSYTPNANYNGDDTITYTVSDAESGWHIHGLGGLLGALFGGDAGHAVTGTVNVDVKAVDDAPVANDDTATTKEDTPVSGNLLANDSDVDEDELTATLETGAAHGTAVVHADGTYTYTPAANFHGEDSFVYKLSDGTLTDTATVKVTVTSVEDAPVGVNDSYSTAEDTALTIPAPGVLSNDTDGDKDPLTVTVGAAPTHGGLTLNSDGSFTYTPAKDFNGADGFTYTVSDGDDTSAPVTVAITVTPVNDKPVANNDPATTVEDTAVTIDVLKNDSDVDHDSLTVTTTAPGATVNLDGSITYKPAANTNGIQTFEYTVSDGHGGTATATVSVTVTAAPDAPVAVADPLTVAEDGSLTITPGDLLGNDSDADGDALSVVIKSQPDAAKGTLTLNADGVTYTYTPVKDFTGTDSFTYAAFDGALSSATVTVTITVTPSNDAPVATDDAATTNEDTAVTIDVLKNDTDIDGDKLTVSTSAPGATVNLDGTITYTPALNTNGNQTFTYTVSDGHGGTDEGSVTVSVTPVQDPPVAMADTYTVPAGGTLNVFAPGFLANDADPDGDALRLVANTDPANGKVFLSSAGSFVYTPDVGFAGDDSFTYTISDGNDNLSTATVSIKVIGPASITVGEPTITNPDTEERTYAVTATGLTGPFTLTGVPAHGTFHGNADGTFTYKPDRVFVRTLEPPFNQPAGVGTDTFTVTATDASGKTATVQVTATIHFINSKPTQFLEFDVRDADDPVVSGRLWFEDVNGDPVVFDPTFLPHLDTPRGQVAKGTLQFDTATGRFTFTPTTEARIAANSGLFNDIQVGLLYSVNDGFKRTGVINSEFPLFILKLTVPVDEEPPILTPPIVVPPIGPPVTPPIIPHPDEPGGGPIKM